MPSLFLLLQLNIYDSQDEEPLPVGVVMGLAWSPLGKWRAMKELRLGG